MSENMERLTYKLDEPLSNKYLHYEYMIIADYDINKGNYGRITNDKIYNKLGRLEDIEEELGIDLITLFKALKEGILVNKGKWWLPKCLLVYMMADDEYAFVCDSYIYKLKDYGKAWWLDKPKDNNICLTQEEFELIKEVLEND